MRRPERKREGRELGCPLCEIILGDSMTDDEAKLVLKLEAGLLRPNR